MKGIFLKLATKGYKHYTENTVEELDQLPLTNHHIITEFAHLREWLRVNYGIFVGVSVLQVFENKQPLTIWHYYLMHEKDGWKIEYPSKDRLTSPQEAYSAAFDYILNNLI
jgi:hypothetical protein